ncbi:hypothetical protein FJ976_19290 [Mesorhizobium sp. B1-1-9]|uniref:hypothetical protein n=1 Tax=Mesorhizobium sp. B1-1-9 TaxID=2589975 RepID=UPI00112D688F|nr:hypothetical protein [Mesorhizobium sp. B1-1-9]TPN48546.1 hypothetical protein FJ976_19290 [Mesorhizobium sp. B1-1-9]
MTENLSTEVTIPVKHLKVVVNRPFDQVRDAFQAALPQLDDTGQALLHAGDIDRARAALEALPEIAS